MNAVSPIVFSVEGKLTEVRLSQVLNAILGTVVTPSGITTLSSPEL